jgi:hypothetical protein
MKMKPRVRAGALTGNHNETLVRDSGKGKGLKVNRASGPAASKRLLAEDNLHEGTGDLL